MRRRFGSRLRAVNVFQKQPRSPRYWREQRAAVLSFRQPYADYVSRVVTDIYAGKPPVLDAERQRLVQLSTAAGAAVEAAGVRIAMGPPGGNQLTLFGVAPIAFAYENKLYRGVSPFGYHYSTPYETVLDALDQADAILLRREEESKRPLRRLDRGLRLVLGFPAYLAGIIFGLDLRNLSENQAHGLWFLSVLADGATLFGFGKLVGWW